MTTAAQTRRNRENAKHSTGPRTEEGKNRSRFNAVKHGCTAKLVLLPEEKPAEFNQRTIGFFEHFLPKTPYEVGLAEEAVYCSWQIQRCRQARGARMYERALMGDADERQRLGDEMTELSALLFRAPNGRPTALPRGEMPDAEAGKASKGKPEVGGQDRPAFVLRRLQRNPLGVGWLLMEWNALLAPIERGEGWNASERFRAWRLLGIDPIDAYLNDDLTAILQACQALDPTAGSLVAEIWNEVVSANDLPMLENEYQRRVQRRPAMDRNSAQEHLIGVIRLEIEYLEEKESEHQERSDLRAELGPNLATFDLSHEGLLMLRYEFAWQRRMDRKMNELDKRREERAKSGRGGSNHYLVPSDGWLFADDHAHEKDVCDGLNDGDEATALAGADERTPTVVRPRGDAVVTGGVAVFRNEPKDASGEIEVTTDDPRGSVRNEPKDASRAADGTTDAAWGSVRNEPSVISEADAVSRRNGDLEELVGDEREPVRSGWFDKAVNGLMRGGDGEVVRGICLRDAVRSGSRDGGGSGRVISRRERRRRKREATRATAG